MTSQDNAWRQDYGIWALAFGYFASYVPYSALTKALSKGALAGMERPLGGFELLPVSLFTSLIGMILFLTFKGWWKHASHREVMGVSLPVPSRLTLLSGLCSAGIIATTTLAYTFEGVSIVFVMLLMRGGVLIVAPLVDVISRRKVRWFSWAGLFLSLAALLVAVAEGTGFAITLTCALDISIYLAAYFFRLRFMSRQAKSDRDDANVRYFVEEQLVASPAAFLTVSLVALVGSEGVPGELRRGFFELFGSPLLWVVGLIGFLSAGTGIFGALILLDKRENTFCVPVNRSSSVLAGVVASVCLTVFLHLKPPRTTELIGAGLIILAILFLTLPTLLEKHRARQGSAS